MRRHPALAGAVAVLWLALGTLAHPSRAAEPTAAEVARALQQKYDAIRDFSANFVQSYTGGVLKKTLEERGKLLVKKPGKMRWDYTAQTSSSCPTASKPVLRQRTSRSSSASCPPTIQSRPHPFLAGKSSIVRDFNVFCAAAAARLRLPALKLVPKNAQADFSG
jgi:hypothetical protein